MYISIDMMFAFGERFCSKSVHWYGQMGTEQSMGLEGNQGNNNFNVEQKIKYLEVALIKQMKDSYNENFKTLKKEIKENIRKWRDLSCS